jgi:L-amino acid N-acyltransferase YncA
VGAQELLFRFAEPRDRDAVVDLARSLPEHDLLFLARDITRPENVEEWIANENIDTILAFSGERVVGYAAIHGNQMQWSSHVAELRVMVSPAMRAKGLGRVLTQEAFALALSRGIEKMIAQMTLDQKGAIAVFEGLGFRPEALLRDHVKDRAGQKHDLLMLSHEVARFEAQQVAYGVAEAFGA